MSLAEQVRAALSTVYDPELDEPVTELGFVDALEVSGDGDVAVSLRLPTPQCAPNFAWLMTADARAAVRSVPGVRAVGVELVDHYTGEEINAAVARGGEFADAFPGETEDDLDALRELFRRKALVARQARVWTALPAPAVTLRLRDLPPTPDVARCVALRRELGLSYDPDAAAFVAGDGSPLTPGDVKTWLRRARLVSLSLETNGGICRSLLAVRYPNHDGQEVAA